MSDDVYISWIKATLAKKSHLNQAGLARQIGRDRSVITSMLRGDREIKASELDAIEAYLGEPRPGREAITVDAVQVVGRIGAAWYVIGREPPINMKVSPALSRPNVRQVAYFLDSPVASIPAGAIVLAVPVDQRQKPELGKIIIVRQERAGLQNLDLLKVLDDREIPGTVVAVAIEYRVPFP